jgi:calpain-15
VNYKDPSFPSDARSLGEWKGYSPAQIEAKVDWCRAAELFPEISVQDKGDCTHRVPCSLFAGEIEAGDIDQGQLGDCWLMTALACLAEANPQTITNLFLTKEYSPRGMSVPLYED